MSVAAAADPSCAPEAAWNSETWARLLIQGKLDLSAAPFYFDWKGQRICSFGRRSGWNRLESHQEAARPAYHSARRN